MAFDYSDVERALCRIPDVSAARIVAGPDDRPIEVHVLASPNKHAKQVVRDIQSVAMATFGLDIDRRVVSVVQLEGLDEARPSPAPMSSTTAEASPTEVVVTSAPATGPAVVEDAPSKLSYANGITIPVTSYAEREAGAPLSATVGAVAEAATVGAVAEAAPVGAVAEAAPVGAVAEAAVASAVVATSAEAAVDTDMESDDVHRVVVEGVQLTGSALELRAEVTLRRDSTSASGSASGLPSTGTAVRLAAQATLWALRILEPSASRADVESTAIIMMGARRVAVAVVVLLDPPHEEVMTGAVVVGQAGDLDAVARAFLSAVNRRLLSVY